MQRIRSPFQDRSNARIGSLDWKKAISPCTRAGCFFRQDKNLRNKCRTEHGSLSCSLTARAKCAGGIGNHGLVVVKPPYGSWEDHGIGVRHPSRPLKSGQKSIPHGSRKAEKTMSASVRPRYSP